MNDKQYNKGELPTIVTEYIESVIKKVRYRRKIRAEVREELEDHFTDALKDTKDGQSKIALARELIDGFGNPVVLAKLIRRGKKRCRSVWQKAIILSFQAVGLCILLFALYVGWFMMGDATVRVDYIARLNEMNRPDVVDEQNAWIDYEKAIELYVEPDDKIAPAVKINWKKWPGDEFTKITSEQEDLIRGWISMNDAAWAKYEAASDKPYCYRQYGMEENMDEPMLLAVLLPHIQPIRDIAICGQWRTYMQLKDGDIDGAIETCITMINVSRHWIGRKILIESIVGMTLSSLAHNSLGFIIAEHELPEEKLAALQGELERLWPDGYPHVDLEFERIAFLDLVQHCFTEGGPGGGHLIPKKLASLEDFGADDEPALVMVGSGLIHAGRKKTVKEANSIYDHLIKTSVMSPYERHKERIADYEDKMARLQYRYHLIHLMLPAFGRVNHIRFQKKAQHEAMITVLGLMRFKEQKGRYPDKLDDLVAAGILKELPADPYSDTCLKYAKRGEEFVLYSVGENFEDNGGIVESEEEDNEKKVDMVYWPLKAD